jgi:Zn-dependent protease
VSGDPAQAPPNGQPVGRGGALLMGRPFGIPVYVAPSWFVVAALITWWFAEPVEERLPGLGAWKYGVSFTFVVLLYLSVLVHELSHSLVALRLGLPVRRISLHLLGGVSEIEREPETPLREFLVAAAGPALSLLLGGAGYLLCQLPASGSVLRFLLVEVTVANILVGLFNLLPGLPLDGGRLLGAGVWRVTGRRSTGIVASAWVGRGLAALLLLTPVLLPSLSGSPVDLVTVIWGALLASFIWLGADQALRVAKLRERLPSLSARALTRRAIPVAADLPLSEALRQAEAAGAQGLVVVDSAGRPVALANEAAVGATPLARRPWVSVGAVSRSLVPALVVRADLTGEALVDVMRNAPASEYLVVEPSGEIYGVLATSDVERAFTRAS